MGAKELMINWIKKQFNRVAKWWLDRQAPPNEFLAYINEQEEQLLKKHGGAGVEWQHTGIKSFFFKKIFRKIFRPIVKIVKKIVKAVIKPILNITEGFLGLFGMSFDMPEMPSPENFEATQQGILVNKQSNVANIPVVYGERKVGGTRVFVGSGGDKNKYLYVCLAVAEGEIDSFTRLYINDEEQNLDSFGDASSGSSTSTIRSITKNNKDGVPSAFFVKNARAKFEFFTGKEDQPASTLLKENSNWTGNHRLQGIAYVACRFEWVQAEFTNGEQTTFNPWSGLPSIQVVIKGKKVLPHSAYSGSDDTNTDTSTYESSIGSFVYSDNPADCLLDYLRNPRYGKGLKDNRISFAHFDAAAQTCDLTKTFGGALGTAKFMSCNTVLSTAESVLSNTKKLLQSCRGYLPYTDGKYRLKIEANETTTGLQFITDDHITSPITIASLDKNARYNEVKVTFANQEKDFESDTVIYQDATYKTQDGGEDLILQVSAPSITHMERAYYHGKYIADRSRKGMTVSFSMTNEGQNIQPGDIVVLTHKFKREGEDSGGTYEFMFNERLFRCLEVSLDYDNTVTVNLIEHDNSADTVTAIPVITFKQLRPIICPAVIGHKCFHKPIPIPRPPTNPGPGGGPIGGQVKVTPIKDIYGYGLSVTTQNTDPLADSLHLEFRVNGAGAGATTLNHYGDNNPYKFYQSAGKQFQPGDKISYQIYTRRANNMNLIAKGSVNMIIRNVQTTASSTNYSAGGYP